MKPAGDDLLPPHIEIVRRRRRTVELRLEKGRLRARVPLRIGNAELDRILPELRARLWRALSRERVFDERRLEDLAREVARTHLADLDLPPFTVRFSRRQQRRWGSCTTDLQTGKGSIRISERLRGHPSWVLRHLLLHELAHLVVPNHGPRFAALVGRDERHKEAEAYLQALESVGMLGEGFPEGAALLSFIPAAVHAPVPSEADEEPGQLPLFGVEAPSRPSARPA